MTASFAVKAPSLHPALAAIAGWFAGRGREVRRLLAGDGEAAPAPAELTAWAASLGILVREGAPLCFVAAPPRRVAALAYERRVQDCGEVLLRPRDKHDGCNALAWLMLPQTKSALNAIHCHEGAVAAANRRSPARDAATLLDEYGVIVLAAREELVEAWRRHAWRTLFHERRGEASRHFRIAVLGHGLMAALARPFAALTAKALVVMVEDLPGIATGWPMSMPRRQPACARRAVPLHRPGSCPCRSRRGPTGAPMIAPERASPTHACSDPPGGPVDGGQGRAG